MHEGAHTVARSVVRFPEDAATGTHCGVRTRDHGLCQYFPLVC
jgi:hypothetical protein